MLVIIITISYYQVLLGVPFIKAVRRKPLYVFVFLLSSSAGFIPVDNSRTTERIALEFVQCCVIYLGGTLLFLQHQL